MTITTTGRGTWRAQLNLASTAAQEGVHGLKTFKVGGTGGHWIGASGGVAAGHAHSKTVGFSTTKHHLSLWWGRKVKIEKEYHVTCPAGSSESRRKKWRDKREATRNLKQFETCHIELGKASCCCVCFLQQDKDKRRWANFS